MSNLEELLCIDDQIKRRAWLPYGFGYIVLERTRVNNNIVFQNVRAISSAIDSEISSLTKLLRLDDRFNRKA